MVGKPSEKRRRRLDYNVKMKNLRWEDVDWIYLAEGSEWAVAKDCYLKKDSVERS